MNTSFQCSFPIFAQYSLNVCGLIMKTACQQEAADSEDDGLAAFNTLRTLSTVLDSVSSQPALFPQVRPVSEHLCPYTRLKWTISAP